MMEQGPDADIDRGSLSSSQGVTRLPMIGAQDQKGRGVRNMTPLTLRPKDQSSIGGYMHDVPVRVLPLDPLGR